jgi:hypothetical protein
MGNIYNTHHTMDRIREYMGLCDIQVGRDKPAAVRGGRGEYTPEYTEYTNDSSSSEDQITGGYTSPDTPVVIPSGDKKVMIV